MRNLLRTIVFCLVVLFVVAYSFQSAAAKQYCTEKLSENMTRSYLDNGMEVVLIERHAAPVVAVIVTVKAGSRFETDATNGASHFLEHLLFNGTQKRTQKQIYDEMDEIGAYNNASTSEDYVNFMILAATEHIDKAMEVQSDMLFHSTFPEEKFTKEKGIVIEEIGQSHARPDYLAELYFLRAAYDGTPYSRPVLGTPLSIEKLTRESVIDFYQRYYVPNNMILMAVGDFLPQEILPKLEKFYGACPARPLPQEQPTVPPMINENVFRSVALDGKRAILEMALLAPALGQANFIEHELLAEMLNSDGPMGLKNSLVSKEKILSLSCSMDYHPGFSRFRISATHATDLDGKTLVQQIRDALNLLARKEISPPIIEGIKIGIMTEGEINAERPHFYGMLASQKLAVGGSDWMASYQNSFKSIPAAHVQRALQRLSDQRHLALSFSPSTAKSEAKSARSEATTLEKKTANGLQIIARQNAGTNVFALHLLAKNRAAMEPNGKAGIANLLHHLLTKGCKGMTAEQFSAALDQYGIKLQVADNPFIPFDDYYTSPDYSFIRLECLTDYHKEALKLFSAMLCSPALEEKQLELVRTEQLEAVRKEKDSAAARAKRLFWQQIAAASPLANSVVGTSESVQSITVADVREFYARYFSPENLIISAVSGLPTEETISIIEREFAALKSSTRPAIPVASASLTPVNQQTAKSEELGKMQSAIVIGDVIDNVLPEDRAALQIANEVLSSRIAFELREKQGLAYSIGSSLEFYGKQAVLLISMGTRKENLEKAQTGILNELQKLRDQPPDDRETVKAANQAKGRSLMRQLSSVSQAYLLGWSAYKWNDARAYENQTLSLTKVTADKVKAAIEKYMPQGSLAIVTVI